MEYFSFGNNEWIDQISEKIRMIKIQFGLE